MTLRLTITLLSARSAAQRQPEQDDLIHKPRAGGVFLCPENSEWLAL